VAEYMKTGALKACDEVERRFFGDRREYVAGPEFTAAGGCRWGACRLCEQRASLAWEARAGLTCYIVHAPWLSRTVGAQTLLPASACSSPNGWGSSRRQSTQGR